MKYFKKLIGERIYLSPRNAEDVEQFTEWLNDFNVTDYIGNSSQVISLAGEKKYLEENELECGFVIVTLDEDKMIGTISLESIDKVNQTAELGIFIGDKNYLSKGYGSEAIKLILDYGFNYLNFHNIMLKLLSANERAFNCYKKCGFKEMGRRREAKYINGKFYDTIYMDLLKSEFNEDSIKNKNVK